MVRVALSKVGAGCCVALVATALAVGNASSHTSYQVLEAETMYLPSSAGQVRTDATASGGKALFLWSNATASKQLSVSPTGRLRLRAKAQNCNGSPQLVVRVDGSVVLPAYGSTAPAAILGNGSSVPWRLQCMQKNKWYDFVLHEKLSTSSSTGYVELWVNSGSGWVKQSLNGQQRLALATLGSANSGGANYHKIALYRQKGMFNVVTAYFADHRIGTSFLSAAPRSY